MQQSTQRPIIGITTRHRTKRDEFVLAANYLESLRSLEGVPILLTPGESHVTELLAVIDGLVLTGGGDICPSVYGGEEHPLVGLVCHERDEFEIALVRAALAMKIPILGICRGMQLLNVVTGGALYPHLMDHLSGVDHLKWEDRTPLRHDVSLVPHTRLADIVRLPEFSVVSWHHQGIHHLSDQWRVAAYSDDDLIEAIEHLTLPWVIGIQWHPEFTVQETGHRRIFEAFVEACRQSTLQRQQAQDPNPVMA